MMDDWRKGRNRRADRPPRPAVLIPAPAWA